MGKPRPLFKVLVLDRNHTKLDTHAWSISGRNRKGKFDILADHSPFLSILTATQLTVRTADKELEQFSIDRGLLKFVSNQAVILTDVDMDEGTPPSGKSKPKKSKKS